MRFIGIEIPAAFVEFDEKRAERQLKRRVPVKRLVGNADLPVFAHRLQNIDQKTFRRGDILYQYAVAQRLSLAQHIANREAVEQPVRHAVALQIVAVSDIVAVRSVVAGDANAE